VLATLALRLQEHLMGCFKIPRVDRISARAKSVDRFLAKAAKVENGKPKYQDPLNQIQDQIGARIVVFYLSDVKKVSDIVPKYFRHIEAKNIVPDSEAEFGYFGKHFILLMPSDIYSTEISKGSGPPVFELQVKTLFQHAWSEAEHDLGYKPDVPLTSDQKRLIAFASAQSWGADRAFDELTETLPPTT
jgi:ppGpp synthetase/RelA/SpoT-type nucleotidyltranferase